MHIFGRLAAYFRSETSFQNFKTSFEKFGAIMATGGLPPPAKKLLAQKNSGGIIFGAIATIRRNQLRKRILQEIFSKELRKFRVAQH